MFGFGKKKIDLEEYIAGSLEGLRMATSAHANTWHFGSEKYWNVDQETGNIVFTFEDMVATAPVQIIGTYNERDNTFMWGWDHPSVAEPLQAAAKGVRDFAKKNNFPELLEHKVNIDEDRAWAYAALAMRLAEANGAYRAKANPQTFVYMTFGKVTLQKA
jgi:hypothetical protein